VGSSRSYISHQIAIQQNKLRYYRSGTGAAKCFVFTHQVAALFLHEMTSWQPSWKCDVKSRIRLRQSMHVYLKNNAAKFHPDPIWKDGALGFFKEVAPTRTRRRTRRVAIWDQFLRECEVITQSRGSSGRCPLPTEVRSGEVAQPPRKYFEFSSKKRTVLCIFIGKKTTYGQKPGLWEA